MTTYVLCQNVAAIQAAPANGALPVGSVGVNPAAGQAPINPQTQTFHAVVSGTSGNVSATIQPVVSNDGVNWLIYGSAIVIAAGATPQQGSGTGSSPWQYYSAYVTAISGTGAKVTVTMAV
ncbi:MAG: hypothetical protein KGP14_01855 [Betaproteobacteria bacterium]|nr:hypothetical protein [Betaproteobacteria bacterium]